jgi:hypothetical protein
MPKAQHQRLLTPLISYLVELQRADGETERDGPLSLSLSLSLNLSLSLARARSLSLFVFLSRALSLYTFGAYFLPGRRPSTNV